MPDAQPAPDHERRQVVREVAARRHRRPRHPPPPGRAAPSRPPGTGERARRQDSEIVTRSMTTSSPGSPPGDPTASMAITTSMPSVTDPNSV